MAEDQKIPGSRIGRFARMASLGAKTGASLLFSKDGTGGAERAAEVLGTMRGIAAKIGQMASYVDGVVPEAQREAYEKALGALRAAAPTSSSASIRRLVEEDFGEPIEELFAAWEDKPFASASIGQVHRATLHDGREVAVKVQHPGIAKAVDSDLKNAGVLEGMVRALGGSKMESKRLFAELSERFREELDYALEAERQQMFRALFEGDPTIRIPEVVAGRSSKRVLTTEMAQGKTLEEAALAPEEERREHCKTLWRFVFKGNLVGGMFNADPHPGNYLFGDNGTITFLDFGCIQPIEGQRLQDARRLHDAALKRDEAGFDDAAKTILETRGGRYEEVVVAYSRHCFEPIFKTPYRITRGFSAGLMERMKDIAKEARALAATDEFVPLPPGMLFMNRLQFGFYSVLARLDAQVDYAEVERGFYGEK